MKRIIKQVEFPAEAPKLTRVAAYARVSSGKDAMLHSLSAQVSYYSDLIQKHPGWQYCGVYADEALTGTKDTRENFQRLLNDCRAGKIDLIITKSISRFARNTVTLLETVRELKLLGINTLATPVLSSGASVNAKTYTLNYSEVCDNMIFNDLETGYFTYEISADVKNYYVSNGTLTSETENVVFWTAPFTVGDATIEPPANNTCVHNTVTDAAVAATCTTSGLTEGSHCSKCGMIFAEQTVVPATGHSYSVTTHKATCKDYELFHYECSKCGNSYDISADQLGQWSETKPEGVAESLIESKTQYRYSDCTSQSWVTDSTGTITYVNSWPVGYNTSHSTYAQYNKSGSKVTASETDTTKTVINSDERVGYLYYHWCTTTLTSSWAYETDEYDTFHVYYDTTDPSNYACDTFDYSYKTAHASCTNTKWWFPVEVYNQSYTTYKKVYDGKTWGAWSEWSDTAYTAVDNTRKVETRTVYRYAGAVLGDHVWSDGICSVCGTVCDHSGSANVCNICGKTLVVPKLTPKYPKLNLVDEVHYNIYFTATGVDDVALSDMGLITWTTPQTSGTYDTAEYIIPGASYINGEYMVQSQGIPAKNLGDTLYFKIYAKLSDGSYIYSGLYNYSAKTYAQERLANSSNEELKALCVALLNYGAAAQQYFNYKPYKLMNAGLTDLGDMIYFRVYAKLSDGTYEYTPTVGYHAGLYAEDILQHSSDNNLKSLVVALMNYGAAAQQYFGYKTDSLMNAFLTEEDLAYADSYASGMVTNPPYISSAKTANFVKVEGGYANMYPKISLGAAFGINCYFKPAKTPDDGLTLYYWSLDDFNAVSKLTVDNATGTLKINSPNSTGEYFAAIENIVAKKVDETLFFAAGYESDGVNYYTSVIAYSVGAYCVDRIANTSSATLKALSEATVVYGFYAKQYFLSL